FVHETHRDDKSLVVELDENSTPELIFSLAENKVRVNEVYKKYMGLEERYMELVEGGMRI
ncbi:MAG: ABC transporter ATP-binding protein, partial [Clostridiaceae bacterium]|nr:ABC transporter ATP-binding protein [Clostridiaceae bacterium]